MIMNVMDAMKMQPIGIFHRVCFDFMSAEIGKSYKDGLFASVDEILPNGVSHLFGIIDFVEIDDMLDNAF